MQSLTQSQLPYYQTQWKENPFTSMEMVSRAYRMAANCQRPIRQGERNVCENRPLGVGALW